MSDGLYPPLNAPPAGAVVPGVQPGTTGQFFGFIVIVYGPAGTPSGVFVYQPGTTPGPGNPPIAGMTASATDLFGNPVPNDGSSGDAVVFVQAAGGSGFNIVMSSGANNGEPELALGTGLAIEASDGKTGIFEFLNNSGHPNENIAANIAGPELVAPNNQFVNLFLESSAADGSQTAFGTMVYGDETTGQTYQVAIWGNGGLFIAVCNRIVGQQPGATVPTADTFHTMTMSTGFNITGNNFNGDPTYAEYTWEPMGPNGSVHIRGNINVTAGPGAAFKLLTGAALSNGYKPSQPRYFPVSFNQAAIISGSSNAMGMGVLETSGNIFVYGGAGVAADSCLVFETTIRLD